MFRVVVPTVLGLIMLVGSISLLTLRSIPNISEAQIIERFHKIYFERGSYGRMYLGVPSIQYPSDNWAMQELIAVVKPDFIVETGTFRGGTALFYAHVLEKVNPLGRVITVDPRDYAHKAAQFDSWKQRVEFIQGSSTSLEVFEKIRRHVNGGSVLVVLDSLHTEEHVSRELELYAPLVSVGSYLVVQDTHLGGHPNEHPSVPGAGPWASVQEFLDGNREFEVDESREPLITQNPRGYLKRVRAPG